METHEEFVDEPAGYVGAHEAVVGTPTDPGSINVPPIKPEATENALAAEAARRPDDVFVPATHHAGGDILDTTGEEEAEALRRRADGADPQLAARDAMEEDLEGRS